MNASEYYRFAEGRRSTRLFRDEPVDPEAVKRIIHAATLAPTACNRQLWDFVVVTDTKVKDRVLRLSHAEQSYLHDAPVLLAVFYDATLESRNPCFTPYVTAGMAIYALLLAAEAEGLGAIYLGGIRRPKGVAEALGAPAYATNLGLICLGQRADNPPAPPHRQVDDITGYNAFRLTPKRYHADIRPHLWSLPQIADFRDKLLWYKGVAIDGPTLHVDNDARFSPKCLFVTGELGRLTQERAPAKVLDVFSYNGDMVQQLLNSAGDELETLYAYDLTPGILEYVRVRLSGRCDLARVQYLLNRTEERIDIPLPDQHVDVVLCYERLEHFEDPLPLVREMRRVLKPDGRILVAVSNRFYPHLYRYRRTHRKDYSLGRNWNRGPERKYEPGQLARCFREAGLTVVRVTGLQPVSLKLFEVAEKAARRLGWQRLGDWLADRRGQHYSTRSWLRNFSSVQVYELSAS
jgi:nitroreductase/ubiquinone/menaquinone biosynthesis C-methylase UbiE